jgi:hypothetical protein
MVTLAAAAAGVWDTKPFTEWSDKDVEKVMTESPWAGKATLTHARAGASLGTVPDWNVIISIDSALPIKQALVRRQIGQGGTVTPAQTAGLSAEVPLYLIAIAGIPRSFQAQAAAIAKAARIKRPRKEPLAVADASVLLFDKDGKPVAIPAPGAPGAGRPGGSGGGFGEDKSGITMTIFLGFQKTDPVMTQDQELEVSTVIGTYEVKKTFKLKDMVFKGQLTL